jgi:hypothetical protein
VKHYTNVLQEKLLSFSLSQLNSCNAGQSRSISDEWRLLGALPRTSSQRQKEHRAAARRRRLPLPKQATSHILAAWSVDIDCPTVGMHYFTP